VIDNLFVEHIDADGTAHSMLQLAIVNAKEIAPKVTIGHSREVAEAVHGHRLLPEPRGQVGVGPNLASQLQELNIVIIQVFRKQVTVIPQNGFR
jgi:hypothetical protein